MNKQGLRIAVFSGLFIVPFIPFLVSSAFFFPFITTKVFVWRLVVEIIFAVWLLLALIDTEYRPRKSLILYSVLSFLVVIGLTDIFGAAPLKSFWSNFERMDGFISLLHLGMFFVVISSTFKEADWKKWWNASLVASFLMICYCVLQILGLKTINQGGVRVDGTFGNAIYLAVYMLFHVFIALLFLWREWRNTIVRWVYGLLILAQVSILYFTATRGAILGLIGGLFVMALLNIRNRESRIVKKVSIALISIMVFVIGGFLLIKDSTLVLNSPVLSRFSSLNATELKTQGRYFVWPIAVEGWKEHPILGWGQENFNYIFQEHYRADMFHLEPWFDRAHNIFLDWLVVGGLLGLASYISLYISLMYLVWRRSPNFSYTDKTIVTGLVAAYFFHNFFVFDHLISYILFFSLLSYVHYSGGADIAWKKMFSSNQTKYVALPIVTLLLVSGIYFVNVKPINTNLHLIQALVALQSTGDMKSAIRNFNAAYSSSYLGRYEVIEQSASNAAAILTSSITIEEKNDFYSSIKNAVESEEKDKSQEKDARYQILAGSFLALAGTNEEALVHLSRAKELTPNKQQVYFEIGSAYINSNEPAKALEAFKTAYELAPTYLEAKVIYLIGAIYAGDRSVESTLLSQLKEKEVVFDDRIVNAYYMNKRIDMVRSIINARIKLDPANKTTYEKYLSDLANQ